jgi:uncharacterized protein (DUF433 family)
VASRLDIVDAPLYAPSEAARFSGLSVGQVRRWLFGYTYPYGGAQRSQAPIIQKPKTSGRYASFLDLIELRVARHFLEHGFSAQKVRAAFCEAASIVNITHAFATKRFFMSGHKIYLEMQARSSDAPNLLELLSGGQWAIEPIMRDYLKQIEFDAESDLASVWWPLGRQGRVVVRPTVAFGAPTVKGKTVKTAAVYDLFLAEGRRPDVVAKWMRLSRPEVDDVIRFEEQVLLARAA